MSPTPEQYAALEKTLAASLLAWEKTRQACDSLALEVIRLTDIVNGPCPICKGQLPPPAEGEDPGPEHYCGDCDGHGTLAGYIGMQTMYAEAYDTTEHDAWLRSTALAHCWRDMCKEDDITRPWWERIAYTFKAWWCLKANWEESDDWHRDYVDVATIQTTNTGYGWDADWVATPEGFGPGTWHFVLKHDGDSTY